MWPYRLVLVENEPWNRALNTSQCLLQVSKVTLSYADYHHTTFNPNTMGLLYANLSSSVCSVMHAALLSALQTTTTIPITSPAATAHSGTAVVLAPDIAEAIELADVEVAVEDALEDTDVGSNSVI